MFGPRGILNSYLVLPSVWHGFKNLSTNSAQEIPGAKENSIKSMVPLFVPNSDHPTWSIFYQRKEQTRKHPSLTGRQRLTEQVCRISESIPKKRHEHLDVSAKNMPDTRHEICVGALQLLSFSMGSIWGINMIWYWSYTVRSSNVARNVLQSCLGVPEIGSFRKKNEKQIRSFSLGNTWLLLTILKAGVGRDTLSPLAPALGLNKKKLAISSSSAIHGGQYDSKHVTFE